MVADLPPSILDRTALCVSFDEVVSVLMMSGLSRQQAIDHIDKSYRIHRIHLSTYQGSYV